MIIKINREEKLLQKMLVLIDINIVCLILVFPLRFFIAERKKVRKNLNFIWFYKVLKGFNIKLLIFSLGSKSS